MSFRTIARRACAAAVLLPGVALAQADTAAISPSSDPIRVSTRDERISTEATVIAPAPEPLRRAVQAAWQQHPQARASDARQAAARARLQAARQPLYNPTLDAGHEREGGDRTDTVGLSMPFDVGGKRRARSAAQQAQMEQSQAQAHISRRDFVRGWITSWAQWATAERQVRTGERRLELLGRFAELARRQFDAGDISGLERDLALLSRDQAQAEQASLIAQRAQAAAALQASGGDAQTLVPDAGLADALPPPAPIAGDLSNLPEVQASDAAARAAQHAVDVARRERIPDPTVGVSAGRIAYGEGGGTDNVVNVTFSVPLFVRNSYRAEVVAANADADVARAESEAQRMTADAERGRVIASYAAAQAAWQRWTSSRGTDVARREASLERSWREGELSTSDYLQQLNQTLDTQFAGATLEAQLWSAWVDYLAAAEQLERWVGLEGAP